MSETKQIILIGAVIDVRLIYHAWLPRLLHAGATTLSRTIRLARAPSDHPAHPAPILVAHELVHVAQVVRWGLLGYWWRIVKEWRIPHDQRSYEQEAIRRAPGVLAGTDPELRASWITTVFAPAAGAPLAS